MPRIFFFFFSSDSHLQMKGLEKRSDNFISDLKRRRISGAYHVAKETAAPNYKTLVGTHPPGSGSEGRERK